MDKIKIIFDTDMGSDCDDTGALAVLHNLENEGAVEIVAETHCGSEITGAVCLKAINTYYGRPDIPIGRYTKKVFLEEENCKRYTKPISEEYLKSNSMPYFYDSVKLLRKTLCEHRNVTVLVVGMLNNISELIKSEGDEISPLSGLELVEQSVDCMYVMGGNFADLTFSEYNILTDVPAARYVAEKFPKEIIYCGFEVGENIMTGDNLFDADENNPVKIAYYCGVKTAKPKEINLRSSWDPITAYCSVKRESGLLKKSDKVTVNFDSYGRTVVSEGGKDFYLISERKEEEIKAEINRYLK